MSYKLKDDTYRAHVLLPTEKAPSGLRSPPLQLVGYYKINKTHFHIGCYRYLLQKARKIIEKNEWLMGSLMTLNKQTILTMKPEKMTSSNFIHELYDPIIFNNKLNLEERSIFLKQYQTDKAKTILQTDSNLCNFFFIRDKENILESENIAIILSINHIISDGATIYRLYNMLDRLTPVYELDRNSSIHFMKQLAEKTSLAARSGEDPRRAHAKRMWIPYLIKSLSRRKNKNKYNHQIFSFKINPEKIKKVKLEYNTQTSYVSTTDILTSWVYSFNPKADNIRIPIDLRPRLDCLKTNLAGNYLCAAYLRSEDIKTPLDVRMSLTSRLVKQFGQTYTKYGTFTDFRKYPYGTVTSFNKFYRKLNLPGMELKSYTYVLSTK